MITPNSDMLGVEGRKGNRKDRVVTDCLSVFPGAGFEFLLCCDAHSEDAVTCVL